MFTNEIFKYISTYEKTHYLLPNFNLLFTPNTEQPSYSNNGTSISNSIFIIKRTEQTLNCEIISSDVCSLSLSPLQYFLLHLYCLHKHFAFHSFINTYLFAARISLRPYPHPKFANNVPITSNRKRPQSSLSFRACRNSSGSTVSRTCPCAVLCSAFVSVV